MATHCRQRDLQSAKLDNERLLEIVNTIAQNEKLLTMPKAMPMIPLLMPSIIRSHRTSKVTFGQRDSGQISPDVILAKTISDNKRRAPEPPSVSATVLQPEYPHPTTWDDEEQRLNISSKLWVAYDLRREISEGDASWTWNSYDECLQSGKFFTEDKVPLPPSGDQPRTGYRKNQKLKSILKSPMPLARGEIEEAKLEECPETPRKKSPRSDPKEEEPSTPKKTKKKRKASPKVADSKPEEKAVSTEWQLVVRGEPRCLVAFSGGGFL